MHHPPECNSASPFISSCFRTDRQSYVHAVFMCESVTNIYILCLQVDNNGSVKPFTFNVLFEPEASQKDLFEHSGVKKLVSMAVDG